MAHVRPVGYTPATLSAYASPALPLAALGLPVYVYLPTFYAAEMGIGLAAVGLLLLAARIWDVVTDPLIGYLSDATGTRYGRRRPWVVAGLPLVLAASWFLFSPPEGAGGGHLIGWSLVLYLGWTMMILPISAWGAELSPDYNERSRITAYREGFLIAGTLTALGLPLAFGYGGADDAAGALAVIAGLVVVVLPLTIALMLWRTPEPPVLARGAIRFRAGLGIIWRNKGFTRLIGAYLLNGIANGLPATLFLLFITHVLAAPDMAGLLLAIYFLCGIASVPLWVRLSYRFGKHKVWCSAMVLACVVFSAVPFLGPGDLIGFFVVCVLTGVTLGADLVLPGSMQADVVDADTLESGVQRTGFFFALWGMVTKLALALAVGLAFPTLELVSFSQSGDNSPAALWTLVALYSLVPVIFKASAIVLMWDFPITADVQRRVRQLIEQRVAHQ